MKWAALAATAACGLVLGVGQARAGEQKTPVVGLDYHYNHELKGGKQFHYTWDDTASSGYSKLGELIRGLGAQTQAVKGPASEQALAGIDVYVIVDPDTPAETTKPHYVQDPEIDAIVEWVKAGGVLVLQGNNKGNAEFKHFNRLANRFGIHFNEDTRKNSLDRQKLHLRSLPKHPAFAGAHTLYMVAMCTLTAKPPAEELYRFDDDTIMAVSRLGKGTVFALGDPWCYNEYIDHNDNRQAVTSLFRWLLAQVKR